MNVYIWPDEAHLTDSYHETGGAVAVAGSLEEAVELVRKAKAGQYGPSVQAGWKPSEPIVVPVLGEQTPQAWIMPDAGCC